MRWEELRWGEKNSHDLRWDEVWSVKCKCEVWSAGCEECSVKCEESVHLALTLHCAGVARRSCSWTTTVQQVRPKHARAWLAHGAYKFYRWKRSYSITLRQLPPRLVRVLLVRTILGWNLSYWWMTMSTWQSIQSASHDQHVPFCFLQITGTPCDAFHWSILDDNRLDLRFSFERNVQLPVRQRLVHNHGNSRCSASWTGPGDPVGIAVLEKGRWNQLAWVHGSRLYLNQHLRTFGCWWFGWFWQQQQQRKFCQRVGPASFNPHPCDMHLGDIDFPDTWAVPRR